ncbi:flavin reductase family protein [Clostridium massiliamazoniense]|uniref:flavin reductase family protein n=1 Tax=Clostridium massiliamazoniense TaxID=1347366 RepID=UPI0006D7F606|nr:flavin reductase family protein [Clostridium massiliamazoniense]
MKKIDFKGSVMLNPVPPVMITSKNKEGKTNVFTVAWTGTICTRPPMLSISIRPERLSYEYIKETMEFTLNIPSVDLVEMVDFVGIRSGKAVDKISELNIPLKEGTNINVPYIESCPISIECKVKTILPLGSHDLFIADVMGSHIDENLLDETGKIHFEKANLICYSHGEYYPMSREAIGKFGFSVATNDFFTEKKVEYNKNLNNFKKKYSIEKKENKNVPKVNSLKKNKKRDEKGKKIRKRNKNR